MKDNGGTGRASWEIVENAGKGPVERKDVGEDFCLERVKEKRFLEDAKKEKQEGMQGQWQQESPAKEVLNQVRRCADTDCTPKMMRFGYDALKNGDWEEYQRTFKAEVSATQWTFGRIREALNEWQEMKQEI